MKEYKFQIIKGNDKEHPYNASACGETFDLAIEHANFWYETGDKIGTDWSVTKIISEMPIDYYPFSYEDAMRFAIEHKVETINAILQQDRVADFDKLDLIKVIVNERPSEYIHLDTACRDALVDIINQNLCDDIAELIMEYTEPYESFTEEDAGQILSQMEADGHLLPIGFTPKDFLEVYKDCEPEEED